MNFTEVMSTLTPADEGWRAEVDESWLQGRSLFGGLQAALAIQAMRAQVPAALPLRALQTTFVAPVPAGPVRVRARVLRIGSNTVHAEARLVDGDDTLCAALGVFGRPRASVLRVAPPPPAPVGSGGVTFVYQPGVFPAFTQHFDVRWLRGDPPFSGGTLIEQSLRIGLRDVGPVHEGHVAALADFIPPIALSLLHAPTPGSSLTWMLEFLGDAAAEPLEGWRVEARLDAAVDGYTSQAVRLFAPSGAPAALSRQSMVVFG